MPGDEIRNEAYQRSYDNERARETNGKTVAEDDHGRGIEGVGGKSEGVQSDGGTDNSGRVDSEDSEKYDAGANRTDEGVHVAR